MAAGMATGTNYLIEGMHMPTTATNDEKLDALYNALRQHRLIKVNEANELYVPPSTLEDTLDEMLSNFEIRMSKLESLDLEGKMNTITEVAYRHEQR